MGKISLPKKNSYGHFLLQAGTYVISSPYMIRFHIRGGAKNKNHFFWHFWAKKVHFWPKKFIFKMLVYFISLHNSVSKNNKFDSI